MGRAFTITNSGHNISGVRKRTIGREIVIGPNAIKFVAITIFAILSIVYLTQSTSGANRSLSISGLSNEKAEMQMEKERLEVEQTRLKSLKEIDNSNASQSPLEPAGAVQHLAER